ncbi:ABC transporter ATP-binding protein [Paenibacillus xylaniclasticus]|uniref:ABC transporter ATP-binding protein n=1 Tax=Paenibacillus xylaniclasticus TaxID=588083 RepID=UPI000FD9D44D|nr:MULTISPECIES: ABC transporter ATP-binding protein [Paenibacillus]GFN30982.1 ABC-type transporter ATP-binding protein EcsA [Paenibacillus curdlanolyticus]
MNQKSTANTRDTNHISPTAAASPVLQVTELVGGYSPRRPVLHGLTFDVRPGEIVGLIGLNGAGKSTAIKHILGLMQPHTGQIQVSGTTLDRDPQKYRSSIAYVPESPVLFDELTVDEHLRLTGMAYGVDGDAYNDRRERLLDQFHMRVKRGAFAEHLSKGMKQKVMIMNALLANPSLFIIDEPFLGLDPLGIRSLLERLVEVKRAGAAVLMSSHILSTVETYCDRYIVLHHGRIAASGTLDDVRKAAGMADGTLDEAFFRLVSDTAGGEGLTHGR